MIHSYIYFCRITYEQIQIGFTNDIKNTIRLCKSINPWSEIIYYFEVNNKTSTERLICHLCNQCRITNDIFCFDPRIIPQIEYNCFMNGFCNIPMEID